MSITDQEQAFLDTIDCNFPYRDAPKAESLITQARSISANAAFCVLYEIVNAPASAELAKRAQSELLTTWSDNWSSPLAIPIANLTRRVLEGEMLPTDQVLTVMREVAEIQGQYAALAVVSHLAYQVAEESEYGLIDALEERIRARWDGA